MKPSFTDAEIIAAAHKLNQIGRHYHWFDGPDDYRDRDSIAVAEFEGLAEEILRAAAEAASASGRAQSPLD